MKREDERGMRGACVAPLSRGNAKKHLFIPSFSLNKLILMKK
jgi:hypothetical protein